MSARSLKEITEFGDFQTPMHLAEEVCRLLASSMPSPGAILEPTCGIGSFLAAAAKTFPHAHRVIGVDINPDYVSTARELIARYHASAEVIEGDFFTTDWKRLLSGCSDPVLVVGNPPWVTNTLLSKLDSQNAPEKSNDAGLSGYEAISGKSNFDISEWMLIRLLDWLSGREAVLAMLCKTTVARRVLSYAWRSGIQLRSANMHVIDAQENFGVSVDACLLVCHLAPGCRCDTCGVFPSIAETASAGRIGMLDGHLVANVDAYIRWRGLSGPAVYRWRSGVKHDCSAVMELHLTDSGYINGADELVDIEDTYAFPLFKSSDIANDRVAEPARHLLVPQRKVGEDTRLIRHLAPKTWEYLKIHASQLDSRRSTIYRRQPRFSVFGVGDYTFAPWKVAVSGLYKQPAFRVVPPFGGKPSVLDDTCYFLACDSEDEALYIRSLLSSEPAQEFYRSLLFPDAKRPITVELLSRLDLGALARLLGTETILTGFLKSREGDGRYATQRPTLQPALFADV